jgi:hypothetical protein
MTTNEIRANREKEMVAIKTLRSIISKATKKLALDKDRMDRRVKVALRNEQGRVFGLVSLMASIAAFPVNEGEGSLCSDNQALLEKIGWDMFLLEDIKDTRGNHSFLDSDEMVIIDCKEPQEECDALVNVMLEDLNLEARVSVDLDVWTRKEAIALRKAQAEKLELEEALEAYETANG